MVVTQLPQYYGSGFVSSSYVNFPRVYVVVLSVIVRMRSDKRRREGDRSALVAATGAVCVKAAGVGVNAWLLLEVAAYDDAAAGVVSHAIAAGEVTAVLVARVEGSTAVTSSIAGAQDGAGAREIGNRRQETA